MKRNLINKLYSAWDLLWAKIDLLISTLRSRASLWFQGCAPEAGFRSSGVCSFKARCAGSIRIGKNVTLLAGHRTNRVGLTNPVLLQTLGEGVVEMGDGSGGSAVVISARQHVSIGKHVKMGGNVRIFDHDFHSLDADIRRTIADASHVKSRSVYIEDDVFIGTNTIILKGTRIGARSIVGAGAVVSGLEIPPDSLAVGNPAEIIKKTGV